MALDTLIPEVWSARLLANLHKALVYGQEGVINTDYEGEIQDAGDTVRINAIGAVTVSSYTKNSNMSSPQTLTSADTALLIDQAKSFNLQIDDVDRAQQKPKVMDEAMREAGHALGDTADQYIAAMYTQIGVDTVGSDSSAQVPSATAGDTVYDYIVDLMTALDENNVPKMDRFVILPPWMHGWLLKDDRFVGVGSLRSDERLVNGQVGQAAGARVLVSNNVPNTTGTLYKVIAGHPMAWTFAQQIRKVEAYRPELRFADAVKGLHLYGAKVIRPTALALGTFSKT